GAQRRQQARAAAWLVAGGRAHRQVVEQGLAVQAAETAAPTGESLQVAAVGGERGRGQAALGPDGVEEALDRHRVRLRERRHGLREAAAVGGGGHAASVAAGVAESHLYPCAMPEPTER